MESEATVMVPEAAAPLLYALMVFWGVIDCFFGFRVFKITIAIILAFTGSLAGAWLGYLRGGSASKLRRVGLHNAQDLRSLCGLLEKLQDMAEGDSTVCPLSVIA